MRNALRAVWKCGSRPSLCLLALLATEAGAAPKVVASIVPIHSLIAGVMGDLAEPALVVRGFQSPHTYQMRPSDAANLNRADVVFWIGGSFETFLDRSISALPRETRVVELLELDGLRLLPNRGGGVLDGHAHQETHVPSQSHETGHGDSAEHQAGRFDAHIWLDADNAKRIVGAVASELRDIDPVNASVYESNKGRLLERLDELDRKLEELLAPLRTRPYVVLHDAYRYLEQRYGLNSLGAIMASPDRMPSAKRIRALRAKIEGLGEICIFREPQFESALLQSVASDTEARFAVVDPIGAELSPGPDAYFEMMRSNADALVQCLSR